MNGSNEGGMTCFKNDVRLSLNNTKKKHAHTLVMKKNQQTITLKIHFVNYKLNVLIPYLLFFVLLIFTLMHYGLKKITLHFR